jgi:pimeloyl-ACP methyl ester carboxylesterase
MTEARRGFARQRGLPLSYLEWGRAGSATPSLLLLHGGSANAHWWDFVAPRLAATNHVVAPDLRGHGCSAASTAREYSLDAHAGDVARLVGELALDRVIVVGHSFGGFTALAAVPALRDRLAGLVLVDSRGAITERSARYLNTLAKFPHPVYRDRDEALRRFRLLPPATSASPEVLAHVARHSIVRREDGTWTLGFDRAALSGIGVRDLLAEKRTLRCPSLLVRGGCSSALSREAFAALAAEMPDASRVEIDDAYHHVMLDQPETLASHLGVFAAACG